MPVRKKKRTDENYSGHETCGTVLFINIQVLNKHVGELPFYLPTHGTKILATCLLMYTATVHYLLIVRFQQRR